MKFDFCIGNPPYQENIGSDDGNASLSKQLFPSFIQGAVEISNEGVCMITPSRWFTADAQDKSFVKLREFFKNNEHISQIHHYPKEKEVFPGVDIAGGVSYFMYKQGFEGNVNFVEHSSIKEKAVIRPLFEEGLDIILSMNEFVEILNKVRNKKGFVSMMTITQGRDAFGIVGKQSVLSQMTRKDPFDGAWEVRCAHEEMRYISPQLVQKNRQIATHFKVFISKGNGGAGILNDDKPVAIVGKGYFGNNHSVCTDSLIPIGCFETKEEAINLQQYLSTRFVRFMIGILKVSQNIYQNVYRFVPIQDFSSKSDINWSSSIREIDQQLYKKYGLSDAEIAFIETHVKEMA